MNIKQLKLKVDSIINILSFNTIFKYAALSLVVFIFAITTINREKEKSNIPVANLDGNTTRATLAVNELN